MEKVQGGEISAAFAKLWLRFLCFWKRVCKKQWCYQREDMDKIRCSPFGLLQCDALPKNFRKCAWQKNILFHGANSVVDMHGGLRKRGFCTAIEQLQHRPGDFTVQPQDGRQWSADLVLIGTGAGAERAPD
ncbi:hypothetical protein FHY30_000488 [Xanthomonas arboricola]|uniref:hypothetical protein n=1 Tax=Xanthomonas campestris TaxID=339 RepID=UPI0023E9E65A|nr:hypothetical protein [Xanthomonas campestris]